MKSVLKQLVKWGVLLIVFLVGVIVAAFVALHFYQPTIPITVFPAPKPISGAAVFYTQAVAALPTLNEEEKKLSETKSSEPLEPEAAKQLVAKYDASLQLVARGAMQPECEWGLDSSKGPAMYIPNLDKMLRLGKMLAFRARLRLLVGDSAGAAEDVLLMFRFARHVSEPKLLINYLMQISVNRIAINLVVEHLQEFDAASLQRISDGIAALPPAHSVKPLLVSEREIMSAYLYNMVANAAFAATKKANGVHTAPFPSGKERQDIQMHGPTQEIKITGGPRVKLLVYWIRRYEQKSLELEKLVGMPYAGARPQLDAFAKNLQKTRWTNGAFALLCLPAAEGVRFKEVQMEAIWTIFQRTLDAQIHNPDSVRAEVAKLRDPYDDSPLEIRDVDGGIEVKLKGPPDKKQPTLTVGLQKK